MKKIIGILAVLSIFILGTAKTEAAASIPSPCDVNAPSSLKIISPNGGEVYNVGDQITVKWAGCDASNNAPYELLYLELIDDVTGGKWLVAPEITAGSTVVNLNDSFTFNIPSSVPGLGTIGGSNYKIFLMIGDGNSNSNSSYSGNDTSDGVFTINNSGTTKVLGKISYWWGKYNLYYSNGVWVSDTASDAGARLEMMSYCKRQFPGTTEIKEAGPETTSGWRSAGNYPTQTSIKPTYICIGSSMAGSARGTVLVNKSSAFIGNTVKVSGSVVNTGTSAQTFKTVLSYAPEYIPNVNQNIYPVQEVSDEFILSSGMKKNMSAEFYAKNSGYNFAKISVYLKVDGTYILVSQQLDRVTVSGVTITPSVTVLSPKGGEQYLVGQKITVNWTSQGLSTSSYNTDIYVKNLSTQKVTYLNAGTGFLQNDGLETFIMPTGLVDGNYLVYVGILGADSYLAATGVSNSSIIIKNNFTTSCTSTSAPSVTVLSPNGGEAYVAGQQIKVTWKSCNIKGNIAEINLDPINGWGGGIGATLLKDITNDGNEIVTLPDASSFIAANSPFGNYYKIGIVAGSSSTVVIKDSSDNTFTINNSADVVNPSIKLIYPNGGETFKLGGYMYPQSFIKYEVKNAPANSWVALALYKNNVGLGYITLGAKTSIPEGIDWKVGDYVDYLGSPVHKAIAGSDYKIEAMLYTGEIPIGKVPMWPNQKAITFDRSDANFTITGNDIVSTPTVKVVSPNGGETFKAGDQIKVIWKTSSDVSKSENVWISLYDSSNEAKYVDLVTKHILNDGGEAVTIPKNIITGNYKIRVDVYGVVSTNDLGTISDSSDNSFQVKNYSDIVDDVIITSTDNITVSEYKKTTEVQKEMLKNSSEMLMKKGTKSAEVKTIQSALKKQGYSISTDGNFGLKTENVVKKYQAVKGLPVTGKIDIETKSSLLLNK